MRCNYQPDTEAFWLSQYMTGGGMRSFAGIPYQRGSGIGSIFKSLFRFILPFAKKLAPGLASEVLGIGGDIARNISSGQDWKKGAKSRAKKTGGYVLENFGKEIQKGAGLGKRGRHPKSIKRTKRNMEGILKPCRNR